MVEQNLILFYPWCYYATQKYHDMRRGICCTYVRYGTKMYGIRNYYRPPLDEASKIIWKILLRKNMGINDLVFRYEPFVIFSVFIGEGKLGVFLVF